MLPLARVSDGQHAQRAMQNILDFFVDRRNYLEVIMNIRFFFFLSLSKLTILKKETKQ